MNILLIDNGTVHIPDFEKLLSEHSLKILSKDIAKVESIRGFDAVILSGSFSNSVIKNKHLFTHQIEIIKYSPVPVFGICLGFELMIHAYGGLMRRRREKITGIKTLEFQKDQIFEGIEKLSVYEGHRWIVQKAPHHFKTLAYSDTGIEVIKHINHLVYGVQFHPEVMEGDINGYKVLQNFLAIVSRQH